MQADLRKGLLQEIRTRLLPVFIEKGFVVTPLIDWEEKSSELRSAFPFGY